MKNKVNTQLLDLIENLNNKLIEKDALLILLKGKVLSLADQIPGTIDKLDEHYVDHKKMRKNINIVENDMSYFRQTYNAILFEDISL